MSNLVPLKARLSQDLVCSLVVCRGSSRGVVVGPPTAFRRRGSGVPWHRCATESRVTLWQSANPCCLRWSRDVVRALRSCSYITLMCDHVKLKILTPLLDWKPCSSSQSSQFSVILIISPIFLLLLVFPQPFILLKFSSNFLTCCMQCRNPSRSRKCKSVSLSED